MIFGRAAELEILDGVIAGIEQGRGCGLAVTGESGIGKTALVDEFTETIRRRCVRVVRIRCTEAESELALSGMSDLFGQLDEFVDCIPAPQALAIRAALALGPPSPTDALSLSLGTLSLLRAAAPIVLVIDDGQWLDPASASCLGFVSRRVASVGLAILVTARDPISETAWFASLPTLRLARLSRTMAEQLLRSVAPDLGMAVRQAVLDAGDGIPLALAELPVLLTEQERTGMTTLPTLLRPGERLSGLFEPRLRRLPAKCRTMLALAAAFDPAAVTLLGSAAAEFHCVLADLAAAEDDGLVRLERGMVNFLHPVARSAAYYAVTASERRRIHEVLSRLTVDDQQAHHLAAAALGPDEAVAVALAAGARRAAERGAEAAAASMYEKASRFAPTPPHRAILQAQAGLAALRSAQPQRASALMESVETGLLPDRLRNGARRFHGLAMRACGLPEDAIDLWTREAEACESSDPEAAAVFLTDAAHTLLLVGAAHEALATAERAWAHLRSKPDADGGLLPLAVLAACRAAAADADGASAALAHWARLESVALPQSAPLAFPVAMLAELWIGEPVSARERCERQITTLREASTVTGLPMLLVSYADILLRLGEWSRAEEAVTEASMLALDIGNESALTLAAMTEARLAAMRGSSDVVRRIVTEDLERADRQSPGRVTFALTAGRVAIAHDALAHGRPDRTLELLERVADDDDEVHRIMEPSVLGFHVDLIEALVKCGRRADAVPVFEQLRSRSALSRNPWTHASVALASLLLADDAELEQRGTDLIDVVMQKHLPLETARAHLVMGERLHRSRRRVEARHHLRMALGMFEGLGAHGWAERTRTELAAAGAKHRSKQRPASELTARELDIVTRIVQGHSNREIATQLFLSTKTVEFHLSRVYGKLGVRSRGQLAHLLQARTESS